MLGCFLRNAVTSLYVTASLSETLYENNIEILYEEHIIDIH